MKKVSTQLSEKEMDSIEKLAKDRGTTTYKLFRGIVQEYLTGEQKPTPTGIPDDQFVFRASDDYHHHTTMRFALPADMADSIAGLVDKGHYPYRTKEDVVRDSLYHRLEWLNANKDLGLGAFLRRFRAIDRILSEEEQEVEFANRLARMDTLVREAPDDDERRALVNEVLDELKAMPSSSWQKHYLEEIKKRWPQLILPWNMRDRKKE